MMCPFTADDEVVKEAQAGCTRAVANELNMPRIRPGWLIVGFALGIVEKWEYDYDIAGIRQVRRRGGLFLDVVGSC